jgi:hypothetical protein
MAAGASRPRTADQAQSARELDKRPLDGAIREVLPAIEGEERRGRIGRPGRIAPGEMGRQEGRHPWPVGHQAALAELALADAEEVALLIDIAQLEPAGLAQPQAEPVEQREERPVGRAALERPRVVRQGGGRSKELPRLGDPEQEGHAPGRERARAGMERRARQPPLRHEPVQALAQDPQEMIEAPRRRPRTRSQEGVQERRRELGGVGHACGDQEAVEESHGVRLGVIPAPERALGGEEVAEAVGEDTPEVQRGRHASTSSPSPSATSRRVSMATFA